MLGTVHVFIRFLYSSCYEEDEMKRFALHQLVLSHSYSVSSLKRVCIDLLEHDCLTKENVIDVLQLARSCDVPQLSFICVRMVVKDLKSVSSTEGWKVMRRANPTLEQELVKSVVEANLVGQFLILVSNNNVEYAASYKQPHESFLGNNGTSHGIYGGCHLEKKWSKKKNASKWNFFRFQKKWSAVVVESSSLFCSEITTWLWMRLVTCSPQ
ncbi:hypothetical protein OIU84_029154 [Salix udensis]|uniref:BTB/POZ domain-containing protein n=1 Tax=Salix udensis TaxID=889485 RepID=A0AAD6P6S8_9ROSI|nr:hypothetical protein OIU84_029154 [Salix udensis]